MDGEIRLRLDNWNITDKPCLLGTARIIQKVKVLDLKWKKAAIPKTTGWCPLLWHFLPGNNIRPESKEIMIVINNNNGNNNNVVINIDNDSNNNNDNSK